MFNRLVCVICLGFLISCQPPVVEPQDMEKVFGPKPTAEQLVTARDQFAHVTFKDPDSAHLGEPTLVGPGALRHGWFIFSSFEYGWKVAFEVNGKNSFGAYEGYHHQWFIWNRGKSTGWVDYEPFDISDLPK